MIIIKFNQFKPIIFLISLLSIGSGIIFSQPFGAVDVMHKETENSVESVTNKQLAHNFQLYDADKILFQLSEYQGQVIVLTFIQNIKNKKVGTFWMKENRKWLEAVQNKYQDDIVISGIKEMTDIPKLLPKTIIRSTLRKESFRFLIDWEGEVFSKYPLNKLFTLFVINTNGQIYYE